MTSLHLSLHAEPCKARTDTSHFFPPAPLPLSWRPEADSTFPSNPALALSFMDHAANTGFHTTTPHRPDTPRDSCDVVEREVRNPQICECLKCLKFGDAAVMQNKADGFGQLTLACGLHLQAPN
eukprot:366309-Chlamydomonas_euryale.AAC.5